MNATLLAIGEDSEASEYEDPTPIMMVVTTEESKGDETFILTPQLMGYIAAALKATGWKPEE